MTTKRPTLTPKQKLEIMARYCRCPGVPEMGITCGKHLPDMKSCEFDHIGQRSMTGDDTLENYRPLCPECHDQKTNGIGGERRVTTAGSDAHRRAHTRALERSWTEHDRRLLAKANGEPKPKSKWPKRKVRGQSFAEQRGRRSS